MGAFGEQLIRVWGGDISYYNGDSPYEPKKTNKMPKTITYKGVEWTLDKVRHLISTDDKACLKALILIHSYQTADEKRAEQTVHVNGKGFNSTDGDFMSSLATQYKTTGSLSPNQMKHCKKAIRKYGGQVFKYIQELAEKK